MDDRRIDPETWNHLGLALQEAIEEVASTFWNGCSDLDWSEVEESTRGRFRASALKLLMARVGVPVQLDVSGVNLSIVGLAPRKTNFRYAAKNGGLDTTEAALEQDGVVLVAPRASRVRPMAPAGYRCLQAPSWGERSRSGSGSAPSWHREPSRGRGNAVAEVRIPAWQHRQAKLGAAGLKQHFSQKACDCGCGQPLPAHRSPLQRFVDFRHRNAFRTGRVFVADREAAAVAPVLEPLPVTLVDFEDVPLGNPAVPRSGSVPGGTS